MAEQYKSGGVTVGAIGVSTMLEEGMLDDNALMEHDEIQAGPDYDSLSSYIVTQFGINSKAREDSGIEDEIEESLRAYNGVYSSDDEVRIAATGGSKIFMNLTATKARAAKSWIADVFKPPRGEPWRLEPTPMEDLPPELMKVIEDGLNKEFEEMSKAQQEPPPGQEQQGQPPQKPQGSQMEKAQNTLREQNKIKRDIKKAIANEITAEAKDQLARMQKKIKDQLKEGDWDKAFSDFLDDFVVYPTAFIKGPIVVKAKGLVWRDGVPVETEVYKLVNKRVHPIDIYPSPYAESVDDGNFMEHMRFDKANIAICRGVDGYIEEAIDAVLEDADRGMMGSWVDTSIEQEKNEQEKRGNWNTDIAGTIHGLHFWGKIILKDLKEWQFFDKMADAGITEMNDNAVVDIEAILVGNHVIKCVLNDDPLKRRPYYKASFMNIPGSFWGKSLPKSMDAQQRMCNAVARALANNMGISSGPQVELYIDRLADQGAITEITPFKIWQLKSDPTGAGGRAISFWQPQSNAGELLKVYAEFESKADDVTGIPKYAYGNDKAGGATQTAQGLAMLLETTSKIIKDCIRNIDEGVLKRRIMFQFHYNMLNLSDFKYTGDIHVCTIGSEALSIRGAEASRRNEFLQATANPTDMAVMGAVGRAAILREMAEDLGLPASIVPSDMEISKKEKDQQEQMAQAQQAQAEAEKAKAQSGIQATTVQIEGQKEMHMATMQAKMQDLQLKFKKHEDEMQLKMGDLQRKLQEAQAKTQLGVMDLEGKKERQTQEIAVKLKKGSGI
jgi:hypothetical protein